MVPGLHSATVCSIVALGFNLEHFAWWAQRVASIGVPFVALYPILHPEAGPLPSVWTMGTCSPHVWRSTEATVEKDTQDDVGEEVDICALCCQKHTTTECGECHLHYCVECIDPHICGRRLFIDQSCLFNLSEQIWWNKVVKVIQVCFSCSMLCMDGLLLRLVGKRQLLVYSGAPYDNGKLGDSIGESHHKSRA